MGQQKIHHAQKHVLNAQQQVQKQGQELVHKEQQLRQKEHDLRQREQLLTKKLQMQQKENHKQVRAGNSPDMGSSKEAIKLKWVSLIVIADGELFLLISVCTALTKRVLIASHGWMGCLSLVALTESPINCCNVFRLWTSRRSSSGKSKS